MGEKLDLEPSWKSLIDGLFSGDIQLSSLKKGLYQLAQIGDIVRTAQKEEKTLIIRPNGTVEVKEDAI